GARILPPSARRTRRGGGRDADGLLARAPCAAERRRPGAGIGVALRDRAQRLPHVLARRGATPALGGPAGSARPRAIRRAAGDGARRALRARRRPVAHPGDAAPRDPPPRVARPLVP